jgi:hypothetical protein
MITLSVLFLIARKYPDSQLGKLSTMIIRKIGKVFTKRES